MAILLRKEKILLKLSVDKLHKSPAQPRKDFDEDELVNLSESIRENGVIQPVAVRELEDKSYEIIAGERRVRAAKLAGMGKIPCIVIDCDSEKARLLSLLENIQRKDLDMFEEAYAVREIMSSWQGTQEEIARKMGKSQSYIANKLRILTLSDEEIRKIREGKLSERHARAFIRIKDKGKREKIIDKTINKKLNVEQTEKLVDECLKDDKQKKGKKIILIKDVRIFMNTISKAVKIMKQAGIDAESIRNETDNYIECIIKIPKTTAEKKPT